MKLPALTLLALAACGGTARPATIGNHAAPGAPGDLRAIDWQNHTYDLGPDGSYTVKDGMYEFAYDENGNEVAPDYQPADPDAFVERGEFSVSPPSFADLTGDGVEEAVIVTYYNGGGTGRFTGVSVFGWQDGKEVVIGGIPGGDRGDGGIAAITVDGAVVEVERFMSQEGDGACCPSKVAHERWRWTGGAFVEDEAARKLVDNDLQE